MSNDLKVAKAFVLPLGGKDAEEKIKILTLSDHPFSPSGVGTQAR